MHEPRLRRRLIGHLQQAHAMERAQEGELRVLGQEIGSPALTALLDQHLSATRRHGDELEARLLELGSAGSLRLLVQSIGSVLPRTVVERLRPDDTCACLRDAVLSEAGAIVAYLLLELEAIHAGDDATATLAGRLRAEELAMRDGLMTFWSQAVDGMIEDAVEDGAGSETEVARGMLLDQLRDVHTLERNAAMMLSTALATVHDPLVRDRIEDHRHATLRHGDEVATRLRELHARTSLRRQAQGMAFAALKGPINLIRAERAAKDLRDMYVVEHMELVAYARLEVLGDRAGDERTMMLAQSHAIEESAMVEWLEREGAHFLLETMAAAAQS